MGRTESSDDEEDDSSESEEEDEQEREERMRLARTHAMLSRELERACATLGVVEDGATTNRETLGLYGEYGASLGTAAGLVLTSDYPRTAYAALPRSATLAECAVPPRTLITVQQERP